MHYSPLGDQGVLIEVGDAIDDITHRRVRELHHRLTSDPPVGVTEVVPALASVAVYYDPVLLARIAPGTGPYDAIVGRVRKAVEVPASPEPPMGRMIEIPVCYGGELGPDLRDVSRAHGISEGEVVALHTAGEYTVYMIGFMPGFPYLGGLDERLATPRRPTPRTMVEAGSVGIGGLQTGIYPIASPGGWNLIGRTPVALFTPESDPPTLLRMGDRVRFREISPEDFSAWGRTH